MKRKLDVLLVFIPVAAGLSWSGADPIVIFAASALAIAPLAKRMGDATEALAESLGPTVGSLLNATLGNAPEIIISMFALSKGLVHIVKASITGSIVGNLLLGLGASMFAGGLKTAGPRQSFDPVSARLNSGLLMLAAFGLLIPAVFQHNAATDVEISREIAVVLFLLYLASLVYTLATNRPVVGKDAVKANLRETPKPTAPQRREIAEGPEERWSRKKAVTVLAAVTIGLALMSELLTEAIDPAAKSLGLTPLFAGVFLLALVGNAAELINAVRFARADQMDLAIGITVGASTQVALLVAPLLVLAGWGMGRDMNLLFSRFELLAIGVAVAVARSLMYDGGSSWIEGLMLLAVYVMLGIGFYYLPADPPTGLLLR